MRLWNKLIIFKRFYILWIYQFKILIIRLVDFRRFRVRFIRGRFIIRFINLYLFRLLFQDLAKLIGFLKLSCNYWAKFIHQILLIFMLHQLSMLLIYFVFILVFYYFILPLLLVSYVIISLYLFVLFDRLYAL